MQRSVSRTMALRDSGGLASTLFVEAEDAVDCCKCRWAALPLLLILLILLLLLCEEWPGDGEQEAGREGEVRAGMCREVNRSSRST